MNDSAIGFRSNNFAWLKAVALVLMLFDHASVLYLRAMHFPEGSSALRLPGRFCIPVFAYLLAYGYARMSAHRERYLLRVAVVAAIAEPCYWLCFHQHGNALVPLALALLAFVLDDDRGVDRHHVEPYLAVGVIAVALSFMAHTWDIALVYVMCVSFRLSIERWTVCMIPALFCAVLCNWRSVETLAALLATFTVIGAAGLYSFNLPRLRLPKALGYGFYPAHLLALGLMFSSA